MNKSYGQNEHMTCVQNEQTNTNEYTMNTNNDKKEKKEKPKTDIDIIIKNYTNNNELIDTIYDFIKMRKAIKKVITDRGLKEALKRLDSFTDNDSEKIQILNNSIFNSWQGLYPIKQELSIKPKEETREEEIARYRREWGLTDED